MNFERNKKKFLHKNELKQKREKKRKRNDMQLVTQ